MATSVPIAHPSAARPPAVLAPNGDQPRIGSGSSRIHPLPARPTRESTAGPSANLACAEAVAARSTQFVATPGKTQQLQSQLPAAIHATFQRVRGFKGCMVMIASQEARLVTVVTFWNGPEASRSGENNAETLRLLLFPYVDHFLRAENCVVHVPLPHSRAASTPTRSQPLLRAIVPAGESMNLSDNPTLPSHA